MNYKNKRSFAYLLLILVSFLYFELIFQFCINRNLITLQSFLFSLVYGFILYIIASFSKPKLSYTIISIEMFIITLIYMIETVYMSIFKKPLILTDIGVTNMQVVVYYKEMFAAIINCLPVIILLCVPLLLLMLFKKFKIYPSKKSFKSSVGFIVITVLLTVISNVSIYTAKSFNPALYNNYIHMSDTRYSLNQFGLLATLNLNFRDLMFKDDDIDLSEIVVEKEEEKEEVIVPLNPQSMDIPFAELIENTSNKNIKKLHEYFDSLKPTNENEYTGMFEGYNLIHITAEAFSPYCISEELTPTLYKLTHSGFVFNNFYVSTASESTCGGEFMNISGLLLNPNRPRGVYTIEQTMDCFMPFTMGHQFSKSGSQCFAYHNNSLTFYNRINTIPNFGYTFKASGSGSMSESKARDQGLLFDLKTNSWPQSDLEMMEVTLDEYADNTPFHAYYMSVSGHSNYSFSGNSMSKKHKDKVDHLDLCEECKGYIACQIEFDQALEYLITQLDERGLLDKTVICFTSDHYPYGLSHDQYEELAGHSIDKTFGLYKNSLVLWNNQMDTVVIDKPCSSIDIIPTLSNLFNFDYDSRLITGKDILSDYKAFVYFTESNSFITDTYMYNGRTNKTYDLSGNEITIDDNQLSKDRNHYSITLKMNQLLIENDYYNTLKDYIK